ncbi:MAG: DNA helicase RecQ [Bacteroidaceae bacterium]|nr:DNA helicase RecQ [Bacteroidaceae bacterium]
MENVLKQYFGYSAFRPKQREIIQHLLDGKDALVLMPTGGGKSMCYQLPALMMNGVTVVVSPLLSLMKDQVESLQANGIAARAINSAVSETENMLVRRECAQGMIKLLYVSPERLLVELPFLQENVEISLFAIDEAHCISAWGHDFRPEYAQLGILRETFPNVPIVALTATADKVTRTDILEQLHIPNARMFVSSFDRPNLNLDVKRGMNTKERNQAILQFMLRHQHDCGIIYCMSRKTTESVAAYLRSHQFTTAVYHAGLTVEEREKAQNDFVCDRVQIVCATIAFGMGINKSNVRFVIHYNLPKSIENFYQEIGRAGRDGLRSDTLLFYNVSDIIQLNRFALDSGQREINMERLRRMQEYAESNVCRRRILLNYFGQPYLCECGHCDVCQHPPQRFDGTILIQKALSAIVRGNSELTLRMVVDVLCGSYSAEVRQKNLHAIKTFGVGRDVPRRDWNDYLLQMLQMGFVEIQYDRYNYLRITDAGLDVLYGRQTATLAIPQREEEPHPRRRKTAKELQRKLDLALPETDSAQIMDEALFGDLRDLRKRLAQEQNLPPYIVFSDNVLRTLSARKPCNLDEFGETPGIGDYKCKKYGAVFLEVIRKYR